METVEMEMPSGAVNGVNAVFIFTSSPIIVFYQGIAQNGSDYSLAGSTVTFNVPPAPPGPVAGLVAS